MPAGKVCSRPGCPHRAEYRGLCGKQGDDHAGQREKVRGTRQARGYGAEHVRLRRVWEPKVATGTVRCARCGELIAPGELFDLGHDDFDRSRYSGPEHAGRCNRAAGGRAAHGL